MAFDSVSDVVAQFKHRHGLRNPLLELGARRLAAVLKQSEAEDYLVIAYLIYQEGIDLPTLLAAAKAINGPSYSPELSLKALSHFGDGNLDTLPQAVRNRLAAAVKGVDLDHLPTIQA